MKMKDEGSGAGGIHAGLTFFIVLGPEYYRPRPEILSSKAQARPKSFFRELNVIVLGPKHYRPRPMDVRSKHFLGLEPSES